MRTYDTVEENLWPGENWVQCIAGWGVYKYIHNKTL